MYLQDPISSPNFVIHTNATSTAHRRYIRALIACALAKTNSRAEQANAYRAALSPIRKLPPELVSEIFLDVVNTVVPQCHSDRPEFDILSPIRLSQVCYLWREIAITMPRLWAPIQLSFVQRLAERKIDLLKTFAQRAFGTSLLLNFHWEDISWDGMKYSECPIRILEITPYFSRIKSLSLDVTRPFFEELRFAPDDSFPILEYFRAYMGLDDVDNTDFIMTAPFGSAYNLKEFYYHGHFSGRKIQLPFQLTHLELDGMSAAQSVSALVHSSSLEVFICTISSSGLTFPNQPALLPQLRALHVRVDSEDVTSFRCLFDHITTPALLQLSLNCLDDYIDWSQSSFTSFISRSSCAPTELDIAFHIMNMAAVDLVEIIKLLPSLIHIHIDSLSVTDEVLQSCVYEGLTNTLPKLETLYLKGYNITGDVALQVARSRWWSDADNIPASGPSRLQKCHIRSGMLIEMGITLEAERLRSEGYDIVIS